MIGTMNILEQEDIIKGLPDNLLQTEAQRPTGKYPPFLVVSEIQRRTDMRRRFDAARQQPQQPVAQQIVAQGIGSMQPQQTKMMASGGKTGYSNGGGIFDEGVDYLKRMGSRIVGANLPTARDVTYFDPNMEEFRQLPQAVVNKIKDDYPQLADKSLSDIAAIFTPQQLSYYENEDYVIQRGSGEENVELLTEPNLDIPEMGDFPERGQETKSKERTNPLYAATMNLLYPQGKPRDVELSSTDRQSIEELQALNREVGEGIKTGIASLSDSLNDPNRLPFPTTAYDVGQQTRMTAKNVFDDAKRLGIVPRKAYEAGYNLTADIGEGAENLARGFLNLDKTPEGFRYEEGVDSPLLANVDFDLFQTDESVDESKIDDGSRGNVTREELIAVANPNVTNVTQTDGTPKGAIVEDGTKNDPTRDAFDLLGERLAASEANLEGYDKTTMGLILAQLGTGIMRGDIASGVQGAAKIAAADKEKREDRAYASREKALDRAIQKEYYDTRRKEFTDKQLTTNLRELTKQVNADPRVKQLTGTQAGSLTDPNYIQKLNSLKLQVARELVSQSPAAFGGPKILDQFMAGSGGLSGQIVATFDSKDGLKFN